MSVDRIEPIRIAGTPRIDRVDRDLHRQREQQKQPPQEREPHDEPAEDDGLPHIDVRA